MPTYGGKHSPPRDERGHNIKLDRDLYSTLMRECDDLHNGALWSWIETYIEEQGHYVPSREFLRPLRDRSRIKIVLGHY